MLADAEEGIVTRQLCPVCEDAGPNALNPGGVCDECARSMGWPESDYLPRQVAVAGVEIMQDGTRRSMYRGQRRGYNETPCACGNHYDLDRNGRCLACRVGADPAAPDLWLSIAHEDRIDNREHAANERAERKEEKEAAEREWYEENVEVEIV